MSTSATVAILDISNAFRRYALVGMLGWQDLRQRYRRSILGPFWLTISMGIMIATIGLVFGQIFKSPMHVFLPFLTIGMVLWAFIVSTITEGCAGFITANNIIKELPLPLFVHILRLIWRNVLVMFHNFAIFPIVLLVMGTPLHAIAFLSIPGFLILVANLTWLALLLGIFCTRYRDLPQIVASILQVFFYLTPIMWLPSLLSNHARIYLFDFNPFYHLIQIVRAPLLGEIPTNSNWTVSLGILFLGWIITIGIYGRYKNRIVYWL